MTVKIDIKKNSRITYGKDGYRAERIAIISGVTGDADELLYNALNDASMPAYGDAHPAIAEITLQSISVNPLGGGNYQAIMLYYQDDGTGQSTSTIRASASTASDETQSDINGDPLFFTITASTYASRTTQSQLFTAQVERPRHRLSFEYIGSAYPAAEINKYLGRVNDAPWNGFASKTLLCSSIDATSEGDNYNITFSFDHAPATWQYVGALTGRDYQIPATAHPTDPTDGVDLYDLAKRFDVYETADFSALGFDLGLEFAEISGTAVVYPSITEADIVAGGKTLVITLYGGEEWVASGATFDAVRQDIIDGLVSNKSDAAGWNAELALNRIMQVGDVVRTSDTVVTITFDADGTYDIDEPESIYVTIPASALVNSSDDIEPLTRYFRINGAA